MLDPVSAAPDHAQPGKMSEYYLKDEAELLRELCELADISRAERASINEEAADLVAKVRSDATAVTVFDKLLQEYGLSSHEGVQLMRLAEALIRTPDFATRRLLIRDKIGSADWASHAGKSRSFLVNQATSGLRFTRGWIRMTGGTRVNGILAKLGDRVLVAVMNRMMTSMGKHFVLGRSVSEAIKRSQTGPDAAYSYDMLGEAALTDADAQQYFDVYLDAIQTLARSNSSGTVEAIRPGLSVKLSALHPRFEYARRDDCVPVLVERMKMLCGIAASAGLWINIDAEECDRAEVTLEVFENLLSENSLADWQGLGLVVQAYQRRAVPVIDHIVTCARTAGRRIAVRLVKGAYWDSEIKRAQELGLADYPVFTRKENTDVSYIACAKRLIDASDVVFPQFATHNAHTAVAVARLAGSRHFEFQRLHGMGEALHKHLGATYGAVSRVYAPVGKHRELLPYLVRRLLENGANSSFVNQMFDEDVKPELVASDPFTRTEQNCGAAHPAIPEPLNILGEERQVASGHDITQANIASHFEQVAEQSAEILAASLINGAEVGGGREVICSPQRPEQIIGKVRCVGAKYVDRAVSAAAGSTWLLGTTPDHRAAVLDRAADLIEQDTDKFVNLCVLEAGKTIPDAIAEIREAVDFCRYYAHQAMRSDVRNRAPLGVVACISPWNFPLAIFLGQVTAALSVGNAVVAKPPPQTPLIAYEAVKLLHRAGVPVCALHLLIGDGAELGTALTRHSGVDGICFTGSTRTAQIIAKNLADTQRLRIPLIAETGGLNTMIVDSTSLLEQAVQDAVVSAFQSAGQRCSACRIVLVQKDIANEFASMLTGAMTTLKVGDPAKLSTDVGPVIDRAAKEKIAAHVSRYRDRGQVLYKCEARRIEDGSHFVAPTLIELKRVSDLSEENFGPVLHMVKYEEFELEALIEEVNSMGFGLTMGVHSRIDSKIDHISRLATVGNLYVNRNQIGAVVGVQPFGGEGMSGTGPKAGGPNYLLRLSRLLGGEAKVESTSPQMSRTINRIKNDPSGTVLLSAARKAAANVTVDRLDALWDLLVSKFGESQVCNWMGELSGKPSGWALPETLPGPTGESNTLRSVPRGVFVVLASTAKETTYKQVLKCILTENACIMTQSVESEQVCAAIAPLVEASGLPVEILQLVDLDDMECLIHLDINGIVVEANELKVWQQAIADRPGALLPILSSRSELWEFFLERTVTINTAAAGGNASLFARL